MAHTLNPSLSLSIQNNPESKASRHLHCPHSRATQSRVYMVPVVLSKLVILYWAAIMTILRSAACSPQVGHAC